jgi:DNA-binding transcriptional MerR regulator
MIGKQKMPDEKRTIGETAKMFNVTPASVRNWVNLLGEHLSPDARRQTGKRFTPEDVSTLNRFHSLVSSGMTWNQAVQLLPETPEVLEPEQPPAEDEPRTTSALQTLELLERFQSMLEFQNQQHHETLQAKNEHIETLKAENERLRSEVQQLKKPFWKRWF